MSPYFALESGGLIVNLRMRKKVFNVHGAFEKCVGASSKVESRSNPRDRIGNHWRPPSDSVPLVHCPGDDEEENASCDHHGFLEQLEVHFSRCQRGVGRVGVVEKSATCMFVCDLAIVM